MVAGIVNRDSQIQSDTITISFLRDELKSLKDISTESDRKIKELSGENRRLKDCLSQVSQSIKNIETPTQYIKLFE